MKKSCIANDNFDFLLDYRLQKEQIIFTDISDWVTAKHNESLEEFTVIVKNDSTDLVKEFTAKVNLSTVIDFCFFSNISTKDCKIDGIYTFQAESCGQKLERTEAIIPNLICGYRQALLKPNKSQEDWDTIQEIFFQIECLKAAAQENLTTLATKHFETASKMIKFFDCGCI